MYFVEGSLMLLLVVCFVFGKVKEKVGLFFIKFIVNKLVDGIIVVYYGFNLE